MTNPKLVLKHLRKANDTKNDRIADYVNDAFVDLRNPVKKKKTLKSENPVKVNDIDEEISNFSKHQKGKGHPL